MARYSPQYVPTADFIATAILICSSHEHSHVVTNRRPKFIFINLPLVSRIENWNHDHLGKIYQEEEFRIRT